MHITICINKVTDTWGLQLSATPTTSCYLNLMSERPTKLDICKASHKYLETLNLTLFFLFGPDLYRPFHVLHQQVCEVNGTITTGHSPIS